jgi:NADPH:quinone reductase-like Zn-dependent oxidoreductase
MRAVQFFEYGGPEVLTIVDVPKPQAKPGRVRIAVKAAAVNAIDTKYRSGRSRVPKLPITLGSDVAGIVDQVGDGVTDVSSGDEVFGNATSGAFADYATLNHWAVKPAGMSWQEAAGVSMAAETATRALDVLNFPVGAKVLINGASGGMGSAAVQLAVARGASVIGVASERNFGYLRDLRAKPVAYGPGLVGRVREVAPDGVDFALDISGSGVIPQLIELTGIAANVVSIADFTADQYGARVTDGSEGRAWHALGIAAELYQAGRFRVEVQQVFPVAQVAAAHALMESRHVRGKVVVDFGGGER